MSKVATMADSRRAGADDEKSIFGFWVYLMTDCILFASLFATYVILRNNTFGGPSAGELFSLPYVLTETIVLLTSSLTAGLALLAAYRKEKTTVLYLLGITFTLGLTFLALEINEFINIYRDGFSWRTSGFLSAFFTLVGTHGLHITAGLIWMAGLAIQIARTGANSFNLRRLTCLVLFWHFLDIIWIFIFTIVFLLGAIQS